MVAAAAPVSMFVAPGPMEVVQARVRRRFGFVFCFGLLFSLQNWTKWAGIIWLVLGILYAAYKTKGFTLRPKLFGFTET